MVFGNDDASSNGELWLFEALRPHIGVIFDVGCKDESLYLDFEDEVHYFDAKASSVRELEAKPRRNSAAHFNEFGLSDEAAELTYYPEWGSFWDRTPSTGRCGHSEVLPVRRADSYEPLLAAESVGLLKIDTEGHELHVLRGFGEQLAKVRAAQFEYGGTYLDTGIKLRQVADFLAAAGFDELAYLCPQGRVPIQDLEDHYQYCNIVATRSGTPESAAVNK